MGRASTITWWRHGGTISMMTSDRRPDLRSFRSCASSNKLIYNIGRDFWRATYGRDGAAEAIADYSEAWSEAGVSVRKKWGADGGAS